ncbi:MAG: sigma-70 family RNA polymerase sigma factor [Acidobacteria bacterium]|nr:sigma-70 family RNA polymerase sigma factor [Acidobacteriota bacterium]
MSTFPIHEPLLNVEFSFRATAPSRDLPSLDDENSLIERVLEGDHDLFHQLLKPYERLIYLSAFSILRMEADADDVAQEAILKAFKNLASFRRESRFSTWLTQITINEARMKLRKDRRHLYESLDEGQRTDEGDYVPTDFADWREIPSEALEQKELRKVLTDAVAALPDNYRAVLMLRDVQHLSIRETAKALSLSEANVKTRLLRARLQLRDALGGLGMAWSGTRQSATPRTF